MKKYVFATNSLFGSSVIVPAISDPFVRVVPRTSICIDQEKLKRAVLAVIMCIILHLFMFLLFFVNLFGQFRTNLHLAQGHYLYQKHITDDRISIVKKELL